jgi:hypothetical protein
MSSSQHDTPPEESTPDRSFAEKDGPAPQSPVSSSQAQYQYQLSFAEDSFVSVEDSDDQQLAGVAGEDAASAAAKRKRRRTQCVTCPWLFSILLVDSLTDGERVGIRTR